MASKRIAGATHDIRKKDKNKYIQAQKYIKIRTKKAYTEIMTKVVKSRREGGRGKNRKQEKKKKRKKYNAIMRKKKGEWLGRGWGSSWSSSQLVRGSRSSGSRRCC